MFLKNENEQKNKTRNTNKPQQQKNTHTSGLDVTDIRISVCLFKKKTTKNKNKRTGLDVTKIRICCFQNKTQIGRVATEIRI